MLLDLVVLVRHIRGRRREIEAVAFFSITAEVKVLNREAMDRQNGSM